MRAKRDFSYPLWRANAQADCNGCHTSDPTKEYKDPGNPFFNQHPAIVNPDTYLAGGNNFGPVGAGIVNGVPGPGPDIRDSLHLGVPRPGARAYASSYRRASCPSSPVAAPTTVPSTSPVFVESGAPPEALRNTGITVAVNVSVPDAPLKRPVPPVI